jgi:putative RNA 2'-phosphotransferase
MTKPSHHLEKLSKFLAYLLGRQPDEFGLVPDSDGFVRIKELLQALHEEQGWRHVRQAHLNEVLVVPEKPVIEIDGARIRALDTSRLPAAEEAGDLPKLLYIAIRQRAYPAVLERGLAAPPGRHLTLSREKEMALRIGRRADNHPILLTVHVGECVKYSTRFQEYGRMLFLADRVNPGTFSGPALPKSKPDATASRSAVDEPQHRTPGSYFPQLETPQPADHQSPSARRRKEPQWKKDRRKARKHKANQRKTDNP